MQRSSGFTLLEVMVALTLTGLALGGLFGIIGGNKRLAWRAETALLHSMQVRSLINFAQLNDEQGEVFINFENNELDLTTGEEFEVPDRKTMATAPDLRGYHITDENGETVASGSYWIIQQVATQGADTPPSLQPISPFQGDAPPGPRVERGTGVPPGGQQGFPQ
ncbi:MAG: prepilin-type N-terminal cleavage/methylation domain-containing protein [Pseudomonadota bacterium]